MQPGSMVESCHLHNSSLSPLLQCIVIGLASSKRHSADSLHMHASVIEGPCRLWYHVRTICWPF